MKSFVTPFNVDGGRIASTTDSKTILEQKIVDVLVTGKYERPTNPDYGVGLQQLLFEGVDELTEADLKTDAGLELGARVSGANILDITIRADDVEESTAVVSVVYQTALSTVNTITFQVDSISLTEESPL